MSIYFSDNEKFCQLIGDNSVDYITKLPSPRFIKSHVPYDLLPKQLRTVKPKVTKNRH